MLLRFGVSNYRSLCDYQEFSLVASKLKDRPTHLIAVEKLSREVLPVIGIYGANASGKSNILLAFSYMCQHILNSHTMGLATGGISRKPFQLDPSFQKQPSHFDCDVVVSKVRYHYGFVIDDDRVLEEWLYAYPSKHRQIWFYRQHDEAEIYFGKFLKGKNKTIAALTRDNCLFLSAAAQNNHEQLSQIYHYFRENYFFYFEINRMSETISYLENEPLKAQIVEFIKWADVGIVDAKIETGERLENIQPLKPISFGHRDVNGNNVFFELNDESLGTSRLLILLGPVFKALNQGKVIIIDELDTSMHPLLSLKLLKLFSSSKSNHSGAQIIFTTHDTNLLCRNVLRRDQIWFTEKDKKGATGLYPLTDIRTNDSDKIEEGYLQGRFGAIPVLGKLDTLFE